MRMTMESASARFERAESKLDQAIRKHGERSHQAEQRRRDLNAERERRWKCVPRMVERARTISGTRIVTGRTVTKGDHE